MLAVGSVREWGSHFSEETEAYPGNPGRGQSHFSEEAVAYPGNAGSGAITFRRKQAYASNAGKGWGRITFVRHCLRKSAELKLQR